MTESKTTRRKLMTKTAVTSTTLNTAQRKLYGAMTEVSSPYKKKVHEVYKKTNGTGKEVPSGNTIDYFVNSVPTTEKRLPSFRFYFPSELPWEKRRRILLTLCDKAITDDDVIASAEELKGIKEYLLMPGTTNQFYTIKIIKKCGSK